MADILFIISKIFWFFSRLDTIIICSLALAVLQIYRQNTHTCRRLLTSLLFLLALIAYTPLAHWCIKPLENRFPPQTLESLPDHVHGIIVLGGAVDPELSSLIPRVEVNSTGDRLTYFQVLSRKYPQAKLVYSSGSGGLTNQNYSEALAVRPLLEQMGIDQNRIVYESVSRNTHENVLNSKKLLRPQPQETWILITSAFHMPRSVGIFNQQSWNVIPFPVDFKSDPHLGLFSRFGELFFQGDLLALGLKEWLGLTAYYMLGRTNAWFPSKCMNPAIAQ